MTFTAQGDSRLLSVFAVPTDTTDEMRFASSDPEVAIVSDKGLVTAIGPGKAEITVTCGAASAVCPVTCSFADDPTGPSGVTDPTAATDPTGPVEPTVPIDPTAKYALNREDFTLFYRGETFLLKVGDLAGLPGHMDLGGSGRCHGGRRSGHRHIPRLHHHPRQSRLPGADLHRAVQLGGRLCRRCG